MQMVLEDKNLWGIVKGDEVEPTAEGTTEIQRRQFQKLSLRFVYLWEINSCL
jgi:hypothetical protein